CFGAHCRHRVRGEPWRVLSFPAPPYRPVLGVYLVRTARRIHPQARHHEPHRAAERGDADGAVVRAGARALGAGELGFRSPRLYGPIRAAIQDVAVPGGLTAAGQTVASTRYGRAP